MSKWTSPPETDGDVIRSSESTKPEPGLFWIVMLQCAPVTATGAVEVWPSYSPFPLAASLITNRCGNAASFPLTDIVQEPCIVIAIGVPPSIEAALSQPMLPAGRHRAVTVASNWRPDRDQRSRKAAERSRWGASRRSTVWIGWAYEKTYARPLTSPRT